MTMKPRLIRILVAAVFLTGTFASVGMAGAGPLTSSGIDDPQPAPRQDNKQDPLTTERLELRAQALDAKLNGKAHGRTHEVARGQYVELARAGGGGRGAVLGGVAGFPPHSNPPP